MYNCLFHLSVSGTYTAPWITTVKQTLDQCGLSYIWAEQKCVNVNGLKMLVEQRLKDQFFQTWHAELQCMSSCDFFCEIKDGLKLEKYLLGESVKSRQALCNLRLSNSRIPKVTGRYKGLERNKRFCNLCTGDFIGDEFHILFECKNQIITANRKKFLPRYYISHPSMFKCIELLQSSNEKVLYKLGLFLSVVLPLFK